MGIAKRLRAAARKKNGKLDPVNAIIYGKANAVKNEPKLPAIFIVPLTVPECSFPISTHADQEGLKVMSAPKTAIEINITAPVTSFM